jgi:hypothetical protein
MVSATKFIDFFVHDILDYSLLNNKERNFTKNIAVFDIQNSIDDVVDTLNDKCLMKEIQIETKYIGFEN